MNKSTEMRYLFICKMLIIDYILKPDIYKFNLYNSIILENNGDIMNFTTNKIY